MELMHFCLTYSEPANQSYHLMNKNEQNQYFIILDESTVNADESELVVTNGQLNVC